MIFSKSFFILVSADTSRPRKHSNHPSLLSQNGHLLRHLGSSWASTCHATKMQSSLLDGHQSAWCALKATKRSLRSSKQVWQVYVILLLNVWILGSQTGHRSILSLAVYLTWEDKEPACIPHWTSRGKTHRSGNEGRLYVKLQRLQFLVAKATISKTESATCRAQGPHLCKTVLKALGQGLVEFQPVHIAKFTRKNELEINTSARLCSGLQTATVVRFG